MVDVHVRLNIRYKYKITAMSRAKIEGTIVEINFICGCWKWLRWTKEIECFAIQSTITKVFFPKRRGTGFFALKGCKRFCAGDNRKDGFVVSSLQQIH